jgi:hypothetical protein
MSGKQNNYNHNVSQMDALSSILTTRHIEVIAPETKISILFAKEIWQY